MSKYHFDAVVFGVDGVLTNTSKVHIDAWKVMFDEYLKKRETEHNEVFYEFTSEHDYFPYIDSKPIEKGVAEFLKSRNIKLPIGSQSDSSEKETVWGLCNKKTEVFLEILQSKGVSVFESSEILIDTLHKEGIKIAVVSSDIFAKNILEAGKLSSNIDLILDGKYAEENNFEKAPSPAMYSEAAKQLGVELNRIIVIDDTPDGIKASSKANVGFVLGLARDYTKTELKKMVPTKLLKM